MREILLALIIFVSQPVCAQEAAGWKYSEEKSAMDDSVTRYATLGSSNKIGFGFPYEGLQTGNLKVIVGSDQSTAFILSLERGQFICTTSARPEGCSIFVRFDDEPPKFYQFYEPRNGHTNRIVIINGEMFQKMKAAKKMKIQASFYQEDARIFEFDVAGFDMEKFK